MLSQENLGPLIGLRQSPGWRKLQVRAPGRRTRLAPIPKVLPLEEICHSRRDQESLSEQASWRGLLQPFPLLPADSGDLSTVKRPYWEEKKAHPAYLKQVIIN
jgi:hypothetical protein